MGYVRHEPEDAAILAAAFAQTPQGLAVLDNEFRYVAINEALAASNDRPVAEHIGLTVQEALPYHWPELARFLEAALAGETVEHTWFDLHVAHLGEARSAKARFQPVLREDGSVAGVTVSFEDITDEVNARRRQEWFGQLATSLAEASSLQEVADLVGGLTERSLGTCVAIVSVPDDSAQVVESWGYGIHPEQEDRYHRVPMSFPFPGTHVLSTRRELLLADHEEHDRLWPHGAAAAAANAVEASATFPLLVEGRAVGVLGLGWPKPGLPTREELDFARTIQTRVASTVERLTSNAREDRAARRADALLRVAMRLNAETTQERVANIIVDAVLDLTRANEAGLYLVSDDRASMSRVDASPAIDPQRRVKYDQLSMSAHVPVTHVVTARAAAWIENQDQWAEFPDVVHDVEAMGWPTVAALPLGAHGQDNAEAFGCLYAHYAAPRRVVEDDRRFLQTVAALASSALERIRSDERDRAARAALDETQRRLTHLADAGIMGVLQADDQRITSANRALLDMLGYDELPEGGLDWRDLTPPGWEEVDNEALQELHERGVTQPFEKEYYRRDGTPVPILVSCAVYSEEPFGVIGTVVDLTERKALEARQRAGLEERAALTRAIQSSLFPVLRVTEPFSLDVAYQPGDIRMALGGDFYDAVSLKDGTLCAVIGDVTGHGPAAAAAGAALRSAWRSLVLAGLPQAPMMDLLEDVLASERNDDPDLWLLATVLLVTCSPDGHVEASSAGHPAPIVIDGTAMSVPLENGLLLGTGQEFPRPAPTHLTLEPDHALVLFTDGLLEGWSTPGSDHRLGEDGLRQVLDRHEDKSAASVVASVAGLNGGPLADDAALMIIRRHAACRGIEAP